MWKSQGRYLAKINSGNTATPPFWRPKNGRSNSWNTVIKKLDKEKQNLIEENEKLNKELEKIKKLNDNLDKELKLLTNKNKMENIIKNYKIENILALNINNPSKIKAIDNKELKEEKVEVINTPKSKHNSNNLSINLNGSNGEVGVDSKKSNPFSVFRLSKVSEIKEIKTDNVDSGDKELKNNLELLNEKCNNGLKDGNQDIGEVNSFNENEDDWITYNITIIYSLI